MIKKILRIYWKLPNILQVLLIPVAVLYLATENSIKYRETLIYLIKKKKFKAVYNFIRAKLFVREEGGSILDSFFQLFPQLTPYPWCIEVEVTTRCDKRCIICEHTYWNEPSIDLTFEKFRRLVDQLSGLIWFNPTGEGEAFLNQDFLKMLRYLKSKSMFVFFNDSFDKINEEIAKELIEIGVDKIEISMQGATKKTYEKIMVGHNFDNMINNLKNFIRIKKEMKSPLPELCFHYIVNKLNVHELPQFIELIASFGGKETFGPGSYVNFSGLLEFPQIQHLVTEIPETVMEAVNQKAKQLNIDVLLTHPSHEQKPSIKECVAWSEPYVLIDGYVLSCCAVLMSNRRSFLKKYAFGNLNENSFKEIWNSKRYKKFREMVLKNNAKVPILCVGCRAFDTKERERKLGVSKEI